MRWRSHKGNSFDRNKLHCKYKQNENFLTMSNFASSCFIFFYFFCNQKNNLTRHSIKNPFLPLKFFLHYHHHHQHHHQIIITINCKSAKFTVSHLYDWKRQEEQMQGEIIMAVKEVNFLNSFGQIAQEALNSISNSFHPLPLLHLPIPSFPLCRHLSLWFISILKWQFAPFLLAFYLILFFFAMLTTKLYSFPVERHSRFLSFSSFFFFPPFFVFFLTSVSLLD